ncbi:hypothetical protein ACU4GR_13220 [Methylobacterium oryzae CBMB20]
MRRPSVSEHVKGLEKAGLVSQKFACITVQDRAGLEQGACECLPADLGRVTAACRSII